MPTLMACQAKMVTVQWNEEKQSIDKRSFRMDPSFVTGYRKTTLGMNEVILSILLPYSAEVNNNCSMVYCNLHLYNFCYFRMNM